MKPTLTETTMLDRKSHIRANAHEIARYIEDDSSRFLVTVAGRPVITSNPERTIGQLKWQSRQAIAGLLANGANWAFLGCDKDDKAYFAILLYLNDVDIDDKDDERIYPAVDLRSLATQGVLSPQELSLAGQAAALSHWHAETRCCGSCGGKTLVEDAGWKRKCWACGKYLFPRMDPAVIMLITDGDRAVLGHESRFPENMYSTLAGYVEPGDDIENAVRRETFEEVGIHVENITFLDAQPWPFPHSLMLGCLARATYGELKPDPNEIEDARWFTREEVDQMARGNHPEGLWIPGPQSIAYVLIQHFLQSKPL